MTILTRKLQELGRVRTGNQVEFTNKKGEKDFRPHRLECFRLTSVNKPRLEYAATLWGGTVHAWEDAPQEKMWELYTEVNALPVIIPPCNALSQYNEIWQGNECRMRCDGAFIIHSSKPESIGTECYCATFPLQERLRKAKEGLACQTVTRLSVSLPDLPGIGVWRVDTKGYYAGMELQGTVEMLQDASAEGVYIECTLQVEQRRVVRRTDAGKVQTQVFPVITVQPNVSMRQLISRDIPEHLLVGGKPQPKRLPETIEELYGDDRRQHVTHDEVVKKWPEAGADIKDEADTRDEQFQESEGANESSDDRQHAALPLGTQRVPMKDTPTQPLQKQAEAVFNRAVGVEATIHDAKARESFRKDVSSLKAFIDGEEKSSGYIVHLIGKIEKAMAAVQEVGT